MAIVQTPEGIKTLHKYYVTVEGYKTVGIDSDVDAAGAASGVIRTGVPARIFRLVELVTKGISDTQSILRSLQEDERLDADPKEKRADARLGTIARLAKKHECTYEFARDIVNATNL